MKIGILSDTHDAHENVLKAIKIFNEHKVSYVFHAGDMVSPFTARAFADVAPAKFIAAGRSPSVCWRKNARNTAFRSSSI